MSGTTKKPKAAKNEAEDLDTVDFEVTVKDKKITLTVPIDVNDAPIEVAEAFEDGKFLKAFMGLIGPQQATKLRAAGLTTRIFNDDVMPAWQEATGLGND